MAQISRRNFLKLAIGTVASTLLEPEKVIAAPFLNKNGQMYVVSGPTSKYDRGWVNPEEIGFKSKIKKYREEAEKKEKKWGKGKFKFDYDVPQVSNSLEKILNNEEERINSVIKADLFKNKKELLESAMVVQYEAIGNDRHIDKEEYLGTLAVAYVGFNRFTIDNELDKQRRTRAYSDANENLFDVFMQDRQFSAANIYSKRIKNPKKNWNKNSSLALTALLNAITGTEKDPTYGSTHFLNPSVVPKIAKKWDKAYGLDRTGVKLAGHRFYIERNRGKNRPIPRANYISHNELRRNLNINYS